MSIEDIAFRRWFRLGIFSLAIVAVYGTMMRYKIVFNLPFLEQKHLLHAHSHFAFNGWITHFLYTALALVLVPYLTTRRKQHYHILIALNMICSFGMLLSFTVQGYKPISIALTTVTLLTGFVYAYLFIRDSRLLPGNHPSKAWAITGLLLHILSSAGPFFLAYMMATKNIIPNLYLASVYYYLHLQYSGWFFFGSMAIVAAQLPANTLSLNKYFRVFAITVLPTLGLSLLWTNLPAWLYIIVVVATFVQAIAWLALARQLFRYFKKQKQHTSKPLVRVFFYASAVALTLKFILQAVSVVPSLSHLVFGVRSIVIAYLHLVLLGVYSLFIIGYLFSNGFLKPVKAALAGASLFVAGVLLNELFLAIQGFAAFAYLPIPYINELLLGAAFLLLCSAVILIASQSYKFKTKN